MESSENQEAPGMLDPEAQQEGVPEMPEAPPIEPEKPDYGKIIHIKQGAKASSKLVAEADIVIEDQVVPMITTSRNGVAGVVAAPELVDQAEVVE